MSKLAIALSLTAATLAACQTDQLNGTPVAGNVTGVSLLFQGYVDNPSEYISLQVLASPLADPTNDGNWIEFQHTSSSTSAINLTSSPGSPLYSWQINGVPQPSGTTRWQPGGVLRTRAVSTDPSSGAKRTLTTFDAATFEQCLGDGLSAGSAWITIGQDCQGVNNSVASLVSTSLSPLDLSPKPPWLSLKGDVDPVTETQNQYYAKWGAPATLAAFKTQFGFTSSDPTATYYNDGDLAIGREMHCHRNTGTGEVACFVNNYSKTPGVAAFGDDPDLTLTNANGGLANAFATVAMVYTPPAAGASATNSVKFVVYGSDANHSRVNTAKLDTVGAHVSVPNNCLTCHGIDANYSPAGHTVDGNARFLPFDPYSYRYSSTIAGLTLAAQQEAFRKLNAIVAATPQTAAEQDFMTGLYAPWTVTTPGAFANDSYVPTGWQSSGNLSLQSSYLGIVKVGCRTCHMSAVVSTLDFLQATDWPQAQVNNIRTILCKPVAQGGTHVMPQAERTTQKLWQSGARGLLITGWPYAKLNAADPAHDNLEACVP